MKIRLTTPPPSSYPGDARHKLGLAASGLSPQQVAESLRAAVVAAELPARCVQSKHGWGDRHDTWNVTFGGPIFNQVLELERERVAKKSDRAQKLFASKPATFGVFVHGERADRSSPWGPCEVTIFYTLRGRGLTALRKWLLQFVEIVDPSASLSDHPVGAETPR